MPGHPNADIYHTIKIYKKKTLTNSFHVLLNINSINKLVLYLDLI